MPAPSVFTYYGGKHQVAPQIVALLPPHIGYVEPFAGGLSVLLAKKPARLEVANDLDGDLMTFWRVLRDQGDDLERLCALTPHSRAEYDAAWPLPDGLSDLERARRVWVKLSQGRAGALAPNGWRHQEAAAGRNSSHVRTLIGYVGRFASVADRLAGVTLESLPALDMIDRYGRDPNMLLYVDPPYLAETRSGTQYRHEMADESSHRDLAAALNGCAATVVLSGYDHPLYDNIYPGWDRAEIATRTGGGTQQGRIEVLWCNREFPRELELAL